MRGGTGTVLLLLVAAATGAAISEVDAERSRPGSGRESREPSRILYPPQSIPLRFDHSVHVRDLDAECESCHAAATTSRWASDVLLPDEEACVECHEIRRDEPERVADPIARCDGCHERFEVGRPVARVRIPRPFVRFSHRVHVRGLGVDCERCHGDVASRGLAGRRNLPEMEVCLDCHDGRTAPSQCTTCHLEERDGRMRTSYPGGSLTPAAWMQGAEHTSDFVFRHAPVAGADSSFCASCHTDAECLECHEASGRVRNRRVHPNDWITTHPVSARRDDPRCVSCHREQSFCLGCHRRAGVVMSGATARPLGARFHPQRSAWVEAVGGASALHHGREARRNVQTCVSCHAEHDCLGCHARDTYRPGGVNPHGAGPAWLDRCGRLMRRNSTPCLLCHGGDVLLLGRCR